MAGSTCGWWWWVCYNFVLVFVYGGRFLFCLFFILMVFFLNIFIYCFDV